MVSSRTLVVLLAVALLCASFVDASKKKKSSKKDKKYKKDLSRALSCPNGGRVLIPRKNNLSPACTDTSVDVCVKLVPIPFNAKGGSKKKYSGSKYNGPQYQKIKVKVKIDGYETEKGSGVTDSEDKINFNIRYKQKAGGKVCFAGYDGLAQRCRPFHKLERLAKKGGCVRIYEPEDVDQDGIDTVEEDGVNNKGDGNQDGHRDAVQSNVASFIDGKTGASYITVFATAPLEITNVSSAPDFSLFGSYSFDIDSSDPVTITVIYRGEGCENITDLSKRCTAADAWTPVNAAYLAPCVFEYTIEDNGALDCNPEDGIISDPVTDGVVAASTTAASTTAASTTAASTTAASTTAASTTPGATTPGATTPGATTPGATTPGATTPGGTPPP